MESKLRIIQLAIIAGFLSGFLAALLVLQINKPSEEDRIAEFYLTENAVHVSPHSIRKHINDGTFVLVDLRSQEEYEREHIMGALSVPAYLTPDKSAYGDVDRIVDSFRQIVIDNPEKDIIVYCYSIPCMTGRKVGAMLAENGIYVKHLGIGWNEWRYFWDLWNHEHEWNQTSVMDYVASGPEPGVFKGEVPKTACSAGDLGC